MNTSQEIILKFLVPGIVVLLPFGIPIFYVEFDVATLLTVVSLIFAILVGFFIATATTNYFRLQSLIADEDSALITMYTLAISIQPSCKKRMRDAIDSYLMSALDSEVVVYVEQTRNEFKNLQSIVDTVKAKEPRDFELIGTLFDTIAIIVRVRQEVGYVARRIVGFLHWVILAILSFLIVVLLLALRDGSIFFSFTASILSLATYIILILIYEIDGNIFLEEQLSWQNSQRVFESIGAIKYFPAHVLKKGRVRKLSSVYRIGTVRSDGTRDVKIVQAT